MRWILIISFLALLQPLRAQTKNTYQAAYGRPSFLFTGPNFHNIYMEYQRSFRPKLFWSFRATFSTEERRYQNPPENEAKLFIDSEGGFAYENQIEYDKTNPGIKQLEFRNGFETIARFYPSIGYRLLKPSRKMGIDFSFGAGVARWKWKGFFSGTRALIVEEGYELEGMHNIYFESPKLGYDFMINVGMQIYFNLKGDFQIGVDATFETYDFGGFPVTQNIFVAKKF